MQLPSALIEDLQKVKGFDKAAFIAAHDTASVTSIRKHPVKGEHVAIAGDPVPWCDSGLYVPQRPVFTLDPAFHAGAYYVQEASSMFLAHLWKSVVPSNKPLRVLDLCAAPGGKTTLIASLIDKDSLLISNDVIRSRASILHENAVRWGYMNNWVACNDPRDFTQLTGYFDIIVIDAPCSGSGLFRKDANALKEWSEANVDLCSARQQRIVEDIWPALKQGGMLIYATCSFSPQEDEEILDDIAGKYDVAALPVPLDPGWGITETVSAKYAVPGYRFFPDKIKGEGFFISAIRKNDAAGEVKMPRYKIPNMNKIREQAGHLLSGVEVQYIQPANEQYNTINAAHEIDWHLLRHALYFRKAGIEAGMPTHKEWIPAHDIALSIDRSATLPSVNVDREQALKFLKREDMNIDGMGTGWNIIKFNELGLGWLKVMQNRANNHLPKHWRIRMDISNLDEI